MQHATSLQDIWFIMIQKTTLYSYSIYLKELAHTYLKAEF